MAEKRDYTESEKRAAVRAVLVAGGFRQGGEACGVPWETIAGWKHRDPQWWGQVQAEVALSLLESLTEASQHKALQLRERLVEMMNERLTNGEAKLNVKTGEVVLVPVSLADITKTFTALGGSAKTAVAAEAPMSDEDRIAEFVKIAEADRASRTN